MGENSGSYGTPIKLVIDTKIFESYVPTGPRMPTAAQGLPVGEQLGSPAAVGPDLNSPALLGHNEVSEPETSAATGEAALLPSIPNLKKEVRRLAGNIEKRIREQ